MNRYKTSKNYKLLYKLVNQGLKVICFIGSHNSICFAEKTDDEIKFYSCGCEFISIEIEYPMIFENWCKSKKVEFIKPNKQA